MHGGRERACAAHRCRICLHASSVAIPYMSVDADAAVGCELATLSEALSATWQEETGMPKARAATWHTCKGGKGGMGEVRRKFGGKEQFGYAEGGRGGEIGGSCGSYEDWGSNGAGAGEGTANLAARAVPVVGGSVA